MNQLKMNIYAVKDTVRGEFGSPYLGKNDAEAIRGFEYGVNTPSQSILYTHSKDMQLYKLGEYNIDTGEITSCVEFLKNGAEFKKEA